MESLDCLLCRRILCDPRTLACFHNFCLDCLQLYCEIQRLDSEIFCPQCEEEILIHKSGITGLKCNPLLIQQLQKVLKQTATGGGEQPCDSCEENTASISCMKCALVLCDTCLVKHDRLTGSEPHTVIKLRSNAADPNNCKNVASKVVPNCYVCEDGVPSVVYCQECKGFLCKSCEKLHSKLSITKQHQTIASEKKTKQQQQKSCSGHPNMELKTYCGTCKHLVCDVCCEGEHSTHNLIHGNKVTCAHERTEANVQDAEDMTDSDEVDQSSTTREFCGNAAATYYTIICANCQQTIRESCSGGHKKCKATNAYQIVTLEERQKSIEKQDVTLTKQKYRRSENKSSPHKEAVVTRSETKGDEEEEVTYSDAEDQSSTTCDFCDNAAATHFCINCQQSICEPCSEVHKKCEATKAHQIVT